MTLVNHINELAAIEARKRKKYRYKISRKLQTK